MSKLGTSPSPRTGTCLEVEVALGLAGRVPFFPLLLCRFEHKTVLTREQYFTVAEQHLFLILNLQIRCEWVALFRFCQKEQRLIRSPLSFHQVSCLLQEATGKILFDISWMKIKPNVISENCLLINVSAEEGIEKREVGNCGKCQVEASLGQGSPPFSAS